MGLFDELGKALKQVGDEIKKSDIDRHIQDIGQGLNKAGKEISTEIEKGCAPVQPSSPAPSAPVSSMPAHMSTDKTRSPHPGYAKIAAWMKRNYRNRITGSGDSFQQDLELELLTAEACSALPAKARKGFMEYLKKQNFEPLLK